MLAGSGPRQRQQLRSRGHNGYSVQQPHCRVNPACSELLACRQGQATGNDSSKTNPHTVFKDAQGPVGHSVQQSHCRLIWKLLGTLQQWFDLSSSGYCGCLCCFTPQDQDLTTRLDPLQAYLHLAKGWMQAALRRSTPVYCCDTC